MTIFIGVEWTEIWKFRKADYNGFITKVCATILPGSKIMASGSYWPGLHKNYEFIASEQMMYWKILKSWPENQKPDYFKGTSEEFLNRQNIDFFIADEEMLSGGLYQKEIFMSYFEKHCEFSSEFSDEFYNHSSYARKKSPIPFKISILKKTHQFRNPLP